MPSWVKHGNKRCDLSYHRNKDLEEKLSRLQHMCGTMQITLRNKTKNDIQIKFCNVIAAGFRIDPRRGKLKQQKCTLSGLSLGIRLHTQYGSTQRIANICFRRKNPRLQKQVT
jgi:hypothetical protein